jgi:hypothetical protein
VFQVNQISIGSSTEPPRFEGPHLLVGPEAGHENHTVVDFAQIPPMLACHMDLLVTIFAISFFMMTNTPCLFGAVAGSSRSSLSRSAWI